MNTERIAENETLREWGTQPVLAHFLAENFDRINKIKDPNWQLAESKIYTGVLLSQLVGGKSIEQATQVVKIDITHRKTDLEDISPEDPILLGIRELLTNKFGNEVIRRVNISLSNGTDI